MCTYAQVQRFLQLSDLKAEFLKNNTSLIEQLAMKYRSVNQMYLAGYGVAPEVYDAEKPVREHFELAVEEANLILEEMVARLFTTEHMEVILNFLSLPFGKSYEKKMQQLVADFFDHFEQKITDIDRSVEKEVCQVIDTATRKTSNGVPISEFVKVVNCDLSSIYSH